MKLKYNISPNLSTCKMLCDDGLDTKLNMYEVTEYMNKHSTTLFIGKPGSGKTSLLYSFFKNKKLFHQVFEYIFIFQPQKSRASMKDNIFSTIADNQIYEELTCENLCEVIDTIKILPTEYNSVIIFDDMTAYLKSSKEIEQKLKELIFNRRHLRTSIYFLCQTYISVPREIRKMFSNLFIFKISKIEAENIFNELIDIDKKLIPSICKLVFDKQYNFLFINTDSQKIYKNFDEIILDDNCIYE